MAWQDGYHTIPYKNLPRTNEKLMELKGSLSDDEARVTFAQFLAANPTWAARILIGEHIFPIQDMLIRAVFQKNFSLAICGRGFSKSWTAAVMVPLYAIFNPGTRIGICSATFRQARELFKKIEEFLSDKKGIFLKQCLIGEPKHNTDYWEMKIGKSKVIALPLGCLTGASRIVTESGLVRIEDLFPDNPKKGFEPLGAKVFNKNGWTETDQRYYCGRQETRKITTESGYEIEGTLNHKLYSEEGWRQLGSFKGGDFVAIDVQDKWPTKPKYKLSADEGYALGLLLGDGCYTHEFRLQFTDSKGELANYLRDVTGWDWRQPKGSDNYYCFGKENAKRWRDYWGVGLDYAKDKRIPEKIFSGSREAAIACLQGLFDTDGCAYVNKKLYNSLEINFASVSQQMITDVQLLLNTFGIHGTASRRVRKSGLEIGELRLSGQDSRKFIEKIGFRYKRKQEKAVEALASQKGGHDRSGLPISRLVSDYARLSPIKTRRKDRSFSPSSIIKHKKISATYLRKIIDLYDTSENPLREEIYEYLEVLEKFRFEKIKSIETGYAPCYDLHVPEGNCYTGNGFVSHNSGEKIRGFRFQVMIIDELLLLSDKVINEVIKPFLAINADVRNRGKIQRAEDKLIAAGKMTEDDRYRFESNKLIGLTSASYKFEYLYELYQSYIKLIFDPDAQDVSHCIFQLSYEVAPEELYSKANVEEAKQTASEAQFAREYRAHFSDDSGGYFSAKKLLEVCLKSGESPCVELRGDPKAEYLLAIDPNYNDSEASDHFAMCLLKLDPERESGTMVHGYALQKSSLKHRAQYLKYLFENFNIKYLITDAAGGKKLIDDIDGLGVLPRPLKAFEADFDNFQEDKLREIKGNYKPESGQICHAQTFSSSWLQRANEELQTSIERKKIFFASKVEQHDEHQFNKLMEMNIPIEKLEYKMSGDDDKHVNKKSDFIEHQNDILDLTMKECVLIEVSSSPTGNQTFDLPNHLKKDRKPTRARKDSYTALLLANWGMKCYFKLKATEADNNSYFMPYFAV